MKFRPCIDIHNGKVKQIVGSSLRDQGDAAEENFVASRSAADFAEMYERDGLSGGHIILLNPPSSDYYEATRQQAVEALSACPGKMQVGGGIHPGNAEAFLRAGASHVIVTSYVFHNGQVDEGRLEELVRAVGREHLVLDLSCRRIGDIYRIVTDRWQNVSDVALNADTMDALAGSCDEFLIHAVDVEGMAKGIETTLAGQLGSWAKIPMTYAGGISSINDLKSLKDAGRGRIDFTIGSALDIFGGGLSYRSICAEYR